MNEGDIISEILDALSDYMDAVEPPEDVYKGIYAEDDYIVAWEGRADTTLHIETARGKHFVLRVEEVQG